MEQYLISDFEGIGFYIFYYITLNKYVETRKQWNDTFKLFKEKNYVPRIPYLTKISLQE